MAQENKTLGGFCGGATRLAAAFVLAGGFMIGAGAAPASAQSRSAATESEPDLKSLVEDFAHYVYVDNTELAEANARAILDLGLDSEEFLAIIEDDVRLEDRFLESARKALRRPGLAELGAELNRFYENGRRARARNIDEIQRNIGLLSGNQRSKSLGRARLVEAGEYAVPVLLKRLVEKRDASEVLEVKNVLRSLNKQAVAPLCAAMLEVRPDAQEEIARILGGIGYEASLPYLVRLRNSTSVDAVRAAADRAIERIGSDLANAPVSALYRELAEDYYNHSQSLTSFPGEEFQPVWRYDRAIGLLPVAVRSEVFHETMSMRLASDAIELDRGDREALAIWIAANFSRESETPDGYENPLFSDARDASYFAVASGNSVLQSVLARAIDDRDTRLARQAIEAMAVSAGGDDIWQGGSADQPLVKALDFPDRRVRYDAALVLAGLTPEGFYKGADRVVPTLAGAIRDGDARYAAVIASDEDRQRFLRETLEDDGFTVLAPGRSIDEVMDSVVTVPGVDVILMETTEGRTAEMIDVSRRTARLSATPVVAILPVASSTRMKTLYSDDTLTRFAREGVNGSQLMANVSALLEVSSGDAIDSASASVYASRAVAALRDIAIASGDIYAIGDATLQLTAAMESSDRDIASGIADVLARIKDSRAQVAVMDRAMNARGAERVEMLGFVTDSARRFGNMLEPRHERWLSDRLANATGDEATASAGLVGALNLSSGAVVDLILGR